MASVRKLRSRVPGGARSDPGGARPKAQALVALAQRAGTETGTSTRRLLSLPDLQPPPTSRASGGALTSESAPQDYQPIISAGALDAMELAAPFESETPEEVHVRLDQLAT